jgi:hypothetical protein
VERRFGYVSLASMMLDLVPRYPGLRSRRHIAIVPLQLIQPFVCLTLAYVLLGKEVSWMTIAIAVILA